MIHFLPDDRRTNVVRDPVLRRRPRRAIQAAVVLGLALSSHTRDALATEPVPDAMRLAWARGDGASSCPDGPAIARDVQRRIGRDPFDAAADRSVEGFVVRAGTRWEATIFVREADGSVVGTREIHSESESCESISAAAALAIALAIDPDAALRSTASSSPPPASSAPPPASSAPPTEMASSTPPPAVELSSASPPPAARPRRRHAPRFPAWIHPHGGGLSVRAVGLTGIVPSAAFGGAIAADGLIYGPLRWSAGALITATSTGSLAGASATFNAWQGWLAACLEGWPSERIGLAACLGVAAGAVDGHAMIPRRLEPAAATWAGPLLEVRLNIQLIGPLFVEAGIQAFVPVPPPHFDLLERVAPPIAVYEAAPVAGIGFVGVGVHF